MSTGEAAGPVPRSVLSPVLTVLDIRC